MGGAESTGPAGPAAAAAAAKAAGPALALWIALLGAVGSLCRYWMSSALQRIVGPAFPAGTYAVNVVGSAAIGAVMGAFSARGAEGSSVRVALTAGLMGGFTTYSSFAFETWVLIERRSWLAAALNVAGTVVVCLAACAGGVAAGRSLAR